MSLIEGFAALDEAWKRAEEKCRALSHPFTVSVPIEGIKGDGVPRTCLGWGRVNHGKFQLCIGNDEKGWANVGSTCTELRILAVGLFRNCGKLFTKIPKRLSIN